MISNRRLRTAVSGLGRIAWDYHIPTLLHHPQFELVAVADPLAERRKEATEHFGIKAVYSDAGTMVGTEKPDLLVIASPTCFHSEQALAAFQSGCNVICEKPLGVNFTDAEEIAAAMRRFDRKLMVYQPHRLTGEAIALKRILSDGLLGTIHLVRRSSSGFSRRNDWQAFSAYGGGMLNNYGSHFLDQFIYLFGGNMRSIEAVTKCLVSCGDAEDFVKILAVNEKEIAFDLEINMASAFDNQDWLVFGACGSARLENDRWQVRYFDPEALKPLAAQSGFAATDRIYPFETDIPWQEKVFPCNTSGSPGYYDYCYRYFIQGEKPLIPVENSLEVMQLLECCRPQNTLNCAVAAVN